jgi:urease accessory protein
MSRSLALLQLVSPALPVGAFSYSEGLEQQQQQGSLSDQHAVEAWLRAELERGAVRIETAALAPLRLALQQWRDQMPRGHGDGEALQRLLDLDRWLLAQREAPAIRAQQRQMGRSLQQLLADLGHPLPLPCGDTVEPALAYPAAFAWAGLVWELSPLELAEGYLYGWVANQLSAAVRLVPLGPSRAQLLQRRLLPLITAQAALLQGQDPRQLWSGGVGASMAQLQHAELYSRLFRS